MSNIFNDAEKKITIPSTLTFKDDLNNEHVVVKENFRCEPVMSDYPFENNIVAINITAETDEGTVTSNITLHNEVDHDRKEIVSTALADVGYYEEDPDSSYDNSSYDTALTLSEKTLDKIKVKNK